jgi:serine/threonine-protein kinase
MTTRISLTVKNGKLAGKTFEFAGPRRLMIGRGGGCDLRLPNDFEFLCASRHHCLIDIDPPEIHVRDLGSRNGTWIDGVQIGRPVDRLLGTEEADRPARDYHLQDGDELKVGTTAFQVAIAATEEGDYKETPELHAEMEIGACI